MLLVFSDREVELEVPPFVKVLYIAAAAPIGSRRRFDYDWVNGEGSVDAT